MKVLKLDVTHELIGSKALNLKVIERSGCKVPETFVLFNDHINTKLIERDRESILSDLDSYLSENKLYAVRSAKGIEDSQEDSFAGIFRSELNVKKKNVYSALLEVAKSYDRVVFKSKDQSHDILTINHSRNMKDSILIQEMVTPMYSGVLFSRNPVNNEDEMLLEMVEGLGDQLDQEGIDPLRASFKKGILTFDDRLIEKDAYWLNRVFKEALKIRKQFGGAIDCEWVYDGHDIYWLQVRPVTHLSKIKVFENGIGKDYMPPLMKPLEYDIITSTTVKAWLRLAHDIYNDIDIDDKSIVRSFYYRPYFNHHRIRQILDEIGLDPSDIEVIIHFDGERFKSSFTLMAKAFFHFSGWFDFFVNRRKRIQQAFDELSQYKDNVQVLRNQLHDHGNKEAFMLTYAKLKELYFESEYLNILIRIGSLNSRKKHQKELEFIKKVKEDCLICIHECGFLFGDYLVELGYIDENNDLMFMNEDMLVEIMKQEPEKDVLMSYIDEAKKLFEEHIDSVLPKIIQGEENPILNSEKLNKQIMTGIAMSKGRTKGRVRIITIDDEMESVKAGEIVILPFADMVFEPVLANAKGLVLKTGGILSHLAILAREHHIPAITSVADIDQLKDGMFIAIDAYSGEIIILEK